MKNLFNLIRGEMIRLYKYKILVIGIATSLIWVLIIGFSDANAASVLTPLLIFMDAAMMSIILLAAAFYLEKQEGTVKTLLVTPVHLWEILFAKAIAALVMGIVSAIVVVAASLLIHGIEIRLIVLFVFILIVVASHTAIGLTLTLFSKDFGGLIVNYALFALIAFLPSLLLGINVIPEAYSDILLISPSHAGQMMITSAFKTVEPHILWISIAYLICLTGLLYGLVIYKRFKKYAIEG